MISRLFFTLSNCALFGFIASAIARFTLSFYSWFEAVHSLGLSIEHTIKILKCALFNDIGPLNLIHTTWLMLHSSIHQALQYTTDLMPLTLAIFIAAFLCGTLFFIQEAFATWLRRTYQAICHWQTA